MLYRITAIVIIAAVLVACNMPQPLPTATPEPTPTQEALQDNAKTINPNPGLTLGECEDTYWFDRIFGQVWVTQCVPTSYKLYEVRRNVNGEYQPSITVPLNIDYTGAAYSVLPGGRAGRVGYTTEEPVRFVANCYVFKLHGQLHLWGEPADYGANIMIGDQELQAKQLPANGMYELVWFWLAKTETLIPVTFYASFAWGSATADSYTTFERFAIEKVTLGHCQ